ncbi:MAG TPA: hypothetical protein VMH02_04590 [Verrucomicrobiae bacterium]|nr:hypothetical protein [Verrucomicrobiae bacterium]
MSAAEPRGRVLGVLSAYGLALAGAALGAVVRVLGLAGRPLAPYHCYDWAPRAATVLTVYLLVAPLAAAFAQGWARAIVIGAVALLALVLATFLWSYTAIVSCSPM